MGSLRTTLVLILLLVDTGSPSNRTDMDDLYYSIMANYNSKMLPVVNHSHPTAIDVDIYITSVNRFDELSGELSVSMIFVFTWTEERISWLPGNHAGITEIFLPPQDIWRPQVYIIEAADKIEEIGNISLNVMIEFNGTVAWYPGSVIKSICSVDVTYFPFDKQTCRIRLIPWGVLPTQLYLYTTRDHLNQVYLIHNSEWEITNSTVGSPAESYGRYLQIDLTLKRRRVFYVVYIIIPLAFLSVLNNLVFLIPATSGERSSVSITTFLSFVVYMGIVHENVPASSEPMSYLYFYLLFLMSYSSSIMVLCTISLRIYDKDGEVPKVVQLVVRFLQIRWLTSKGSITCLKSDKDVRFNENQHIQNNTFEDNQQQLGVVLLHHIPTNPTESASGLCRGCRNRVTDLASEEYLPAQTDAEHNKKDASKENMTWSNVGKTFDMCTFIILMCVYCGMTIECYTKLAFHK